MDRVARCPLYDAVSERASERAREWDCKSAGVSTTRTRELPRIPQGSARTPHEQSRRSLTLVPRASDSGPSQDRVASGGGGGYGTQRNATMMATRQQWVLIVCVSCVCVLVCASCAALAKYVDGTRREGRFGPKLVTAVGSSTTRNLRSPMRVGFVVVVEVEVEVESGGSMALSRLE